MEKCVMYISVSESRCFLGKSEVEAPDFDDKIGVRNPGHPSARLKS